jgi:hypothetical protein
MTAALIGFVSLPSASRSQPLPPPTRGTLWEIHAIMAIEVWNGGNWIPFNDSAGQSEPLMRTILLPPSAPPRRKMRGWNARRGTPEQTGRLVG